RFGYSTFTDKVDGVVQRNRLERMPDGLTPERREKLTHLFGAVRRFADEQYLAEAKDRSKIVAAASVEPGKESTLRLPMLAAVTEFKTRA
ncbi:hypothetical protein ACI0FS_18620, partial [Ochrobactrum quorumnocens]|uniref:hypothetical protein n=1 Tax=Ochrobactrum quorumnocens TaxID=271865 RepID=UPI003851D2D3